MSGELFRKYPERRRAGLVLLVIAGLLLTLLISFLPTSSRATSGPQEPNGGKNSKAEFVAGEVLVRYRTEAHAEQQTLASAAGGTDEQTVLSESGRQISVHIEHFEGSDIVPGLRIARVAAADTLEAIEALRKQPNVVYAEPNYLLYADVTNPNDPRFLSNELYGLTKIGAPLAWDTTQGSSSVVVAVIDEGIDRLHQDLQANIWINPGDNTVDGVDNDGNGFIDDVNGYNFLSNTGVITPDNHGTHVGGTIGAVGNNGIGVVGVNWNVRLMSLKFIGSGTGSTADAIRACNYAKQMRDLWVSSGGTQGANLRVLNNSYGGGGFSQSFLDAITGLNQSSILFVASAGNVNAGASEPNNEIVPHYPSSYVAPNVIGVANTDASDNLSGSSHYGLNTIHLGAPGTGILSTTPSNNYGFLSGTSMAAPHVTGSAALLLAQNPNLTIQQLKSLLIFNGDPAAALQNKTVTGRRLNIANTFQALAENDTTPPGTVTNFQVNTQSGRSFNIGWTASGDDGAAGQASLYQLTFTDATTSAVIPLTNVLPATTGTAQSVDIKLPYRHTAGTISLIEFDNVGNVGTPGVLGVTVPTALGDPYLTSLSSPAALSTGGTPLSLIGDDKLKLNQALPFSFPFFGQNYTSLHVSTNGNLFFSAPPTRANGDADDVPSSVVGLTQFKMISGLWDDLRTDRNSGDVFMIADANHVIFRWKGATFGDGTPATEFPVNFEIELLPDGTIHTRYGAGNTNLNPVVGIGGGEPEAYDIPSHTSEQTVISLTNAQQVTFSPRVKTLTVASVNPASGVNITMTPADNNGQGNGTTEFTRAYDHDTVVNLTAPTTASGNNFLKWQRDGVDWATTAATSVTIDANRTMTAVYATQRTLTVASSNPASGVTITVTPADNTSAGDGTTPFARTYNENTAVNLTAPATASGNNFLKWQRDGVDWATTAATSVTMDVNHTMTAVYITPRTLTVASSNPASGVNITVSPADNNSAGNGATQFTRTYNDGAVVNLTAPATAGGNNFLKWQRDGANFLNNTNPATSVTMDGPHTMTAIYVTPGALTVNSLNPSSGVNITVTPLDNGSLGDGTTPFTRTYNEGATVTLTAPATASGNSFLKWQRNGVDWAATQATSITMGLSDTMTAVYSARTLTVASVNPSSGVSVTVSPADNNAQANGTTLFTRSYNNSTSVTLTAAATAGGNNFVKWQKNGADVLPFNTATTVTMDNDYTMTAVYSTPRTLTVSSSNPSAGVNIIVMPNDIAAAGNGTTPFARTYNDGTVVNLTAPATAGGNNFLKWQKDGVDAASTLATTVTMDAAHTMTAVYITPRTLTVASVNPASGVSITVTPNDNAAAGNGTTQFTRTYNDGATVSLTAPATADGNNFLKWQKDGVDWATTLATTVMLDGDRTMTAVYITPRTLTVTSVNPASGVNIGVSPNDNVSLGNGTTQFTRTYNDGTTVNLSAPATASGNNFVKWQRDGGDFVNNTSLATSVTMDAAHTMTAVYATPRVLTINSLNPSSGVTITVTPSDINNAGNGPTPLTRTYHDGATVDLTAPANAGGNPFLKWQKDGVDFATTQQTSVTMDAAHTMTAVFVNTIQLTVPQYNVAEADGSVTVTVTRSGPTTATASVDYTTSDGDTPPSAKQKGDYIFRAGQLNFAVGEASKSFTVLIVDDVYQEGTETFKVTLSNPVGAPLGVRSVANVSISDNDVAAPTSNPLDNPDARFFVRQHYLDFLNREPDTAGLNFWRNEITSCGTNQGCIEVKRINVSAAFFRSIEFQETGYLVERLYKTAYGDATGSSTLNGLHNLPVPIVRYFEFLADSQQISADLVVGQPGWEIVLEGNKRSFTAAFVARTRFTTEYPGSMSPNEFVTKLDNNAGVVLTASERNQLISDLTSGAKTRAEVLRQIAEDPDLKAAEDSRAFVLMQYFGYLRRNPNDAPELGLDYTGYDFWLTKLNQFNGNYISAEMVKAFIEATEYRQRFGP